MTNISERLYPYLTFSALFPVPTLQWYDSNHAGIRIWSFQPNSPSTTETKYQESIYRASVSSLESWILPLLPPSQWWMGPQAWKGRRTQTSRRKTPPSFDCKAKLEYQGQRNQEINKGLFRINTKDAGSSETFNQSPFIIEEVEERKKENTHKVQITSRFISSHYRPFTKHRKEPQPIEIIHHKSIQKYTTYTLTYTKHKQETRTAEPWEYKFMVRIPSHFNGLRKKECCSERRAYTLEALK